jgi:hypothetical protein
MEHRSHRDESPGPQSLGLPACDQTQRGVGAKAARQVFDTRPAGGNHMAPPMNQ